MTWLEPVDLYCERLDPGFWAEPVNALSNLGFILVGIWYGHAAWRARADLWTQALCLLVVAVGVGSFLFHTLANRWSELADVIPIWTFVGVYVVYALRRFLGLPFYRVTRGLAITGFLAGFGYWAAPSGAGATTNGSIEYAPAVVALVIFVAALTVKRHPAALQVAVATAVFALSLTARSFDLAVCPAFPIGVHFLWHLLNATMLGLLLSAAISHGSRPSTHA